MNLAQNICFYLNNPSRLTREAVRTLKSEGAIPEGYCGSLSSADWILEMQHKIKQMEKEKGVER